MGGFSVRVRGDGDSTRSLLQSRSRPRADTGISDRNSLYLRYMLRVSQIWSITLQMNDLRQFADRLAAACPGLSAVVRRGDVRLQFSGGELRLGSEQDGQFSARERDRFRAEGTSFVDISTGEVFANEKGLYLFVRLGRKSSDSLSAYQCALLASIQIGGQADAFAEWATGSQVELIDRIKFLYGVEVSPMVMSRFLAAIRKRGVLPPTTTPTWDRDQALAVVRTDFRLSAVGRVQTYAGEAPEVQDKLTQQFGERFVPGVAEVLSSAVGAWIEPRDFLADPSALPEIRKLLGPQVGSSYRGPVVQIRPTNRAPLRLLTKGTNCLLPLLGAADALKSDSPVTRQAGKEAWAEGEVSWK